MMHDDDLLDSIAVFALGALPEAQARPIASHIATCADCSREYASLRDAASAVGYAAELAPGEIDELTATRLKSRVMRAVRADVAASAPSVAPGARNGVPSTGRTRTPWLVYGGALAAAIVAAVSLVDDASQRAANGARVARVAELERDVAAQSALASAASTRARTLDARVARIVAPGSKHFPVVGGEVIASDGRIFMAFPDLPKLPKGKVYQAWTLASGAKTVAPSITFAPEERGVTLVELPGAAGKLAAVALSVEPDGGSKAPTSKPNFVRPLS